MKYLCLIYNEEKNVYATPRDELEAVASECTGYDETLKQNGQFIACERLQPVNTATTIRLRDGKTSVTDGPFAETKEHLGGFYIVEAPDLDTALAWAAKVTDAIDTPIEVRPFMDVHRG
jgi:hypothetical protein